MRGGYQIIDLKNKNFTTGVGIVFEGVYDLLEGTRKAILFTGIQVDDTEFGDTFVELDVEGSAYIGIIYGTTIKIEDTDVITIGA